MLHRSLALGARTQWPPAAALIAASWLLVLVSATSGLAPLLGHAHLLEDGRPFMLALPAFLVGWAVMVAAMMLPTLPRAALGSSTFLAGYIGIWSAFGVAAFALDAGIHWAVDHVDTLAANTWLIQAGLLGVAAVYQLTRSKAWCLSQCCLPPPRELDLREGGAAGAISVGCCWGLMLTGFAFGMSAPLWMAGITGAMLAERDNQGRGPARTWIALGLLVAAIAAVGVGIAR